MKKTKDYVLNLTIMGLLTALICVLAPLSIPLPGGVPISLTNMVIYFIVYLIGGKKGTACFCVYLLLGLIGLPVFSGFTGGIGKLAGPTGGYLIGFIFTATMCGLFLYIGKGKIWIYIFGMIAGLIMAYLFGSLWFMYSMNVSLMKTLTICVFPFLIGDVIKMAVIVFIGPLVKKLLRNINGIEAVISF